MIEGPRRAFNAAWSEDAYADYKAGLAEEVGCPIGFRVCETPVFLPGGLREAMVGATLEIWEELLRPENLEHSKTAVPAAFDVPGCDERPLFAQADFAIVAQEGRLVPRLIELQGFPSLYAFQFLQNRRWQRTLPNGPGLDYLLGDLDADGYLRVVGAAILGGLPPENVVLLDLDPRAQSTFPDFAATERLWGVRSVCPTEITKRGRELYYDRDGRRSRVLRIYNRVIVDELVARGLELPFRLTEPLDVQWAGHPNWFFRWSKHSLPRLRHPVVPEARLLSELDSVPEDLAAFVLKPLFSFSGSGVKVDVTPEDIAAVPREARAQTLLMRKVEYAPVIETPDGGRSRVEVRIMCVGRSGRLSPVTTLARLSRGPMMGVKHNRDRTWVGSTGCLWEKPATGAPA
jgi:hypothetical protein